MHRKESESQVRSDLIAKGYIKPNAHGTKNSTCKNCKLSFVQLEDRFETQCNECSGANERAYRQLQNHRNNRRS